MIRENDGIVIILPKPVRDPKTEGFDDNSHVTQ